MEYRAVGNRCAVSLDSLGLLISNEKALAILVHKGFTILEIDIVSLARWCVASSQYRRGAVPSEAPRVVDCSSFIKWLYGERGIWLPRRSIQQRELGEHVVLADVQAGDVVFTRGVIDYYYTDSSDGVGHVGLATGEGTVIHAANSKVGVIETPLASFVDRGLRGVRRYIPKGKEILTLETPENRGVEIPDDLRWIILQSI